MPLWRAHWGSENPSPCRLQLLKASCPPGPTAPCFRQAGKLASSTPWDLCFHAASPSLTPPYKDPCTYIRTTYTLQDDLPHLKILNLVTASKFQILRTRTWMSLEDRGRGTLFWSPQITKKVSAYIKSEEFEFLQLLSARGGHQLWGRAVPQHAAIGPVQDFRDSDTFHAYTS